MFVGETTIFDRSLTIFEAEKSPFPTRPGAPHGRKRLRPLGTPCAHPGAPPRCPRAAGGPRHCAALPWGQRSAQPPAAALQWSEGSGKKRRQLGGFGEKWWETWGEHSENCWNWRWQIWKPRVYKPKWIQWMDVGSTGGIFAEYGLCALRDVQWVVHWWTVCSGTKCRCQGRNSSAGSIATWFLGQFACKWMDSQVLPPLGSAVLCCSILDERMGFQTATFTDLECCLALYECLAPSLLDASAAYLQEIRLLGRWMFCSSPRACWERHLPGGSSWLYGDMLLVAGLVGMALR